MRIILKSTLASFTGYAIIPPNRLKNSILKGYLGVTTEPVLQKRNLSRYR